MGKGIKETNGHHDVPVINLQPNPKGSYIKNLAGSNPKTNPPPHVVPAKKRGHTLLPQDRPKAKR